MSDDYDYDDYEPHEDVDDVGGSHVWETGDQLDQFHADTFGGEDAAALHAANELDGSAAGGAGSAALGEFNVNPGAVGELDGAAGDDDALAAGGGAASGGVDDDVADMDDEEYALDDEAGAHADDVAGGGAGADDLLLTDATAIPTEDALVTRANVAGAAADDEHERDGVHDGDGTGGDRGAEEEDLEYAQDHADAAANGDEPLISLLQQVQIDESPFESHGAPKSTSSSAATSHVPLRVMGATPMVTVPPASSVASAMDILERSWRQAQARYDVARRHLAGPTVQYEDMIDQQVQMTRSPLWKPHLRTLVNEPPDVQVHTILASMYQLQAARNGYQRVEAASEASMAPHISRAPRRIDETTVQLPDSAFVASRHNTDNIIKSQFAVQAENVFLLFRVFCSIHERMRLRNYVLVRGYPPMNEAAFVRTFCMTPEAAGPGLPVWLNRCGDTLSDVPYGSVDTPHDQLYLETVRLPDYELHRMLPVLDVSGIKRKLSSMYFVRAALFTTDQQTAGTLNAPFDLSRVYVGDEGPSAGASGGDGSGAAMSFGCSRSYPYSLDSVGPVGGSGARTTPSIPPLPLDTPSTTNHVALRLTANESDTVHVCFLEGAADTRMIYKYLKEERENTQVLPAFLRNPKDESTSTIKNARIPIAELFVVVDRDPNEVFRGKIRDLHTEDMPPTMRCIIDVWGQERLWISPLRSQMVDRMEIVTKCYPPRIQALMDKGRTDEAKKLACTGYLKMLATDDPVRFIGAKPGNFIRAWKTATKNSNPTLYIVL